MRKNILSLFILLASLFFVGCGSNSKRDPIVPVKAVMQNTHFNFSNTQDNLLIDGYKEYAINFKVIKDGFGFPGAEVKLRSFDIKYGSIKDETVKTDKNGNSAFIYTPPEKFPNSGESVTLQYVFLVPLEDNSTSELVQNIHLTFDLKQNVSENTGKYFFSNVTKELLVETHQKYTIGFKLNKDGFGFAGEVKVKSFDSKYGTISNETVTTDENGVGVFNYTPPEKFPKTGTTYRIEFVFVIPSEDEKKDTISEKVTLKFQLKEEEAHGQANYYFNETIDKLNVISYKRYTIPFKLNKDNFVQSGVKVKMKTFDSKYGSVEKPVVVTDENGRAQFTYNPPKNMPKKGTTYTIEYVYEIILDDGEKKDLVHKVILEFNYDENIDGNGRATNLSISYKTTTCDKKEGIIEHFSVHATDINSRKPVVGIKVAFSLINGVRILQGTKVQRAKGTIKSGKPTKFSDNAANFNSSVTQDDTLIVLPTQGKSAIDYVGGWSIDDVSGDLQLNGNYNNIKTTSGLTYIIGNEKRLLGGDNGSHGRTSAIHVKAINAETDEDGFAYFDLLVDPILGGHTITVEAHGDENGKRFGTAQVEFMRTGDFTAASVVFPNSGGSGTVIMSPRIIPGCVGDQPLIDLPTGNYEIAPSDHCFIDSANSNFHTDGNGHALIQVVTDGNVTAAKECTLSWKGGSISVGHEY